MDIPGILQQTQIGMIAGNPADSAMKAGNDAAAKQANLNKIGGANGTINISPLKTSYSPTGGPGQNPSDIHKLLAQGGSQGAENAKYDSYAFKGGKRKFKNNKKSIKNKSRKSRKCKKSRKSRKCRK